MITAPPPREAQARRAAARRADPRAARLIGWTIIGLVSLMSLSSVVGFVATTGNQATLNQARLVDRQMRFLQQALVDAETGVRGYVLTGNPDYLEPYHTGINTITLLPPAMLAQVDRYASSLPGAPGDPMPATDRLEQVRAVWNTAIGQVSAHDQAAAAKSLVAMHGKHLMDGLRADIGGFLSMRDTEAAATERRIGLEQNWTLLLNLLGGASAAGGLTFAFHRSIRDALRRERAVRETVEGRRRTEKLFAMAEMLQSATDREDANEVLRASAIQLLPGLGGALYVFNNSRDRLDISTSWSACGDAELAAMHPDYITPAGCWALKRGKPHLNSALPGALRCAHAVAGQVSLELPMAARGEVYGLLEIIADGDDAEVRLAGLRQMAGALADAMSLALASITLREQLRNQALRDPLTGLYNRRFLEEMQERLGMETERRETSLSAIMIDLDHFKLLNDQFGHATGDAVLRQVAMTITHLLPGSDVACRFGGEELAILMPDCTLEAAVAKAETIRTAICGLSKDGRLPPVSASLGVACWPTTTVHAEDLLPAADAALYVAKQQGRNRVVATTPRGQAPMLALA